LPAISLVGLVFAVHTVVQAQRKDPPPPPVIPPPRNPFPATIAGAGVVEPANERATAIGPPVAAVVLKVYVSVGEVVSAGTPLFRLDDRTLLAERRVRAAALDVARSRLDRLVAQPRPEDVPPLEAQVAEAQDLVQDFKSQVARLEKAFETSKGIVSLDELDHRRWQLAASQKSLQRAEANLAVTKAGAWSPDIAQSRAELEQAQASVEQTDAEIERYTVRAPSDGTVLQVNVRDGEYASATQAQLIVFGDTRTLHVRVDVDEESAPLVRPNRRALALMRGFPNRPIRLDYVRTEPYVQIKRSLTGDNTERVDTRVLQVIWKLGPHDLPVYVGQQLDVFMESDPRDMPEIPIAVTKGATR
jgi:multidrug efflux pump subunit AcrA (membrane-fusion protein)